MKLYMVPLAPNPTKVMLYLAERAALGTDLAIEQVVVNTLKARHREPEHLARNPFGTLPVLELDDGDHLIESLSIIEYLEERFPDDGLLGTDLKARAKARELERIVELRIAIPIGGFVHATKSPIGYPANPTRAAEAEASVQQPLDYLESLLSDGRELLLGDRVAVADCTLQAALQFMRFAGGDLLGDRRALRDWDRRYRARESVRDLIRW
ncbi:MAG: glutathione S-transferase family protein [Burkholderiaceae bacterium]|nr:glutathione S-transferase family protein [Burkholderiaceae bacterium]